MRKVLTWIGGGALFLLLVGIAGVAYLMVQGSRLDNESRAYADSAVRPVVEHWNAQALKDRAAPALLANLTPERLSNIFQWLSTLGALTSVEPCTGQARIDVSTGNGRVVSGKYTCKAQFQSGEAVISLVLVKNDGEWRIAGFHVNSPALVPREQGRKI